MHALTDAFIKGRTAHKKAVGSYFEIKGKTAKSCAVGAVYYGLFEKVEEVPGVIPTRIAGEYTQARYDGFKVPCDHDDMGTLIGILIHLNDDHKDWPDKKIAEWMDKVLGEYDREQTLPPV